MIQTFDFFNQADSPSIFLCNPNRSRLASIGKVIYGTNLTLRFNALSEFSFTIPKSIDNGVTYLPAYDMVEVKKQIFIENIGYFIINSAIENSEGEFPVTEVTCQSAEAEMLSKKVNLLSGTCRLYNVLNPTSVSPTDSLLGYIISLLNGGVIGNSNGWSLGGTINGALASKYRTFDVSDNTVYNFLMTDIAQAFECIFTFDTINKRIYVDTLAEAVTNTSIFVSYNNLAKQVEISKMSDEIATALYVYGGDGIDIRSVNPTGSNIIYDFSYYMNTGWMTQGLIDAITAWETKISNSRTQYNTLMTSYLNENDSLAVLETAMGVLEGEYATLEINLKVAIDNNLGVGSASATLASKQSEINAKQQEITTKETQITSITNSLIAINNDLSMNNASNFTENQRIELSTHILENTYQNENIIVTDSFTSSEVQETKIELYNQAKSVLSRSSQPRYEFSMEAINFVHLKEFSSFTSQIPVTLGAKITIGTETYPIESVLLELSLSYDNPEDFSMVFSNRLRLDNGAYKYSDLVGQVVKTGSTISFNKPSYENWSRNYKNTVVDFVTSPLNATLNEIINASDQEIVINAAGLRGRRKTGSNTYEKNEVWLTDNTLAFTDDAWNTAKTAVGRINLGGGVYGYGIVGEYILGNIIAGNDLTISNSAGTFTVNEIGATLVNSKMTIASSGGGGLVIDPLTENIFSIGSIIGGLIPSPKFSVSKEGNVTMRGDLELDNNQYIRKNGTLRLANGGFVIDSSGNATFTGTVSANKVSGLIDWSQIVNTPLAVSRVASGYPASSVGSGTMSNMNIVGSDGSIKTSYGGFLLVEGSSGVAIRGSGNNHYINISNTGFIDIHTVSGRVSISGNLLTWNGSNIATQTWVQSQGYGVAGYNGQQDIFDAYGTKKRLSFTNGLLKSVVLI